MNTGRRGCGLCKWVWKNGLIVCGGFDGVWKGGWSDNAFKGVDGKSYKTVEVYDMGKDIWINKPETNYIHKWYPLITVYEMNIIVVIGDDGRRAHWGYAEYLDTRDCAQKWQNIDTLPDLLGLKEDCDELKYGHFQNILKVE